MAVGDEHRYSDGRIVETEWGPNIWWTLRRLWGTSSRLLRLHWRSEVLTLLAQVPWPGPSAWAWSPGYLDMGPGLAVDHIPDGCPGDLQVLGEFCDAHTGHSVEGPDSEHLLLGEASGTIRLSRAADGHCAVLLDDEGQRCCSQS